MMRLKFPRWETAITLGFVASGALWGGFLGFEQLAGVSSILDRFENLTIDWRYSLVGPRPAPRGVVIAAIDDETVREAGAYPLPRETLAKIVKGLAAFNPQVVAIDIAFLDTGEPESNVALAEALRSTRSVVAAIGLFDRNGAEDSQLEAGSLGLAPTPSRILWPIAQIRDASRTGLANIATDATGIPRYIPLIFRAGDVVIFSFALATAALALNTEPVLGPDTVRLAARTTSTDLGYHLPIHYYGPTGSIRGFSAARVLQGDLDPNEVRGQIVLLGATAVGVGDTFATPFDRDMPGVEVFATGITNLLAGDSLTRTESERWIDAAVAIVLPVLTVLLIAMRRAFVGLGLAAIATVLWIAFTCLAFDLGYWLSIAIPLATCLPVAASYGVLRLGIDRYNANHLASEKATLARFQSPLLLDYILRHPHFLEQPVQQNIAAVFLDLSGYTGVAETLGPKWARDLLAGFQTLVERDVAAERGFVASFMGDGAMIIFGLPEPRPDDASRALRSVLRLRQSISDWLRMLPPVARERLNIRIGAHVGPVVVSRLGPAHHQHITATGDTVNVTSRLLEVAKQEHCTVVISEDLCIASQQPDFYGQTATSSLEVDIRERVQPLRIRIWK